MIETRCPSQLEVFRAMAMTWSDPGPPEGKVDGAYLFGHTPDNESSIITAGVQLYLSGYAAKLLLCGGGVYAPNGVNAYAGGDAWAEALVDRGVDRSAIIQLPRPELSHTGTEAKALVEYARSQSWKTISVTCCPMHQLRGFISAITFVVKSGVNIRVYSRPGTPLSWNDSAVSSQGQIKGSRFDVGLGGEWDRINRVYDNEYDLLSYSQFLSYLNQR